MDLLTVTCPRCGAEADERFYGPCTSCRTELRAKFLSDGRVVEVAEYEPVSYTHLTLPTSDLV